MLVSTGKPADGLRYLRDAQARAARLPEIGYHVAEALLALNRNTEAREQLERILAGDEKFSERQAAEDMLWRLSVGLEGTESK